MSKLSKSEVEHVAHLAGLELSPSQIKRFSKQLSEVITYFEELSEVDTSRIEPTSQTTGLENVRRADEIRIEDSLGQDEALSGTDKTHNGYFVVPHVFGEQRSE